MKELQHTKSPPRILPTNMVKRKTIVLKPRLDQYIINQVAEKLKEKIFTRLIFIKPKPSQIQLTSIKEYYEQYLIVKGKYSLDHCKKLAYNLEVDKNAQEVFILDETFRPDISANPNSSDYKAIKLTGVASFHYENEARFILDNKGREIDPEKMRTILNEEWPEEKLTKSGLKKRLSKVQISPEEEVNFLRSRLVKRPPDVGEVIKEMFEINERKIIHSPMYQLKFENTKTGKEANVKINGITGTIILTTFNNKTISSKFIEDLIKNSQKNIQPIKTEPVKTSRTPTSDNAKKKITETKTEATPHPVPKPSEVKVKEETLEFPAKVVGDVFYVGDKVTAIVGDLEIPSGTTVYETLVVKGNLIIGKDCKILGTVKALGTIVIGANTIIKGNVVSGQNVSVGTKVKIHGKVLVKKPANSGISATQGGINE